MTPKLIEPGNGSEPAREIPIQGEEFLVGRGNDCDLRLRDPNISRHHCLIRLRPEEITVVDLGSSNGTFVNGDRIISQRIVHSGDEISVAQFRFVLDLGDGEAGKVADVDALARTVKLRDLKERPQPGPQKEESHLPGEAGGRGSAG